MKKNYTEIVVVLDRSGSMQSIKDDTIGGFNRFLKDQKAVPGTAAITLAQFDDQYEVVLNGVPIADAKELTGETFVPRGWTALLDAIGRTINTTGARLASMADEDRPEKVVFVIITDGEENRSKEFNSQQINEMIDHQRETYKWEFVFLGANQDAIKVARSMGIHQANAMTFAADSAGVSSSYDSFSDNVAKYRSGVSKDASFSAEDRQKQSR